MRKNTLRLLDKRALSPIFATLMLAAIVITFGTVAYYYASNVTTNATNQFSEDVASNQQAISERIFVERVEFKAGTTSTPAHLIFYVLNCGSANNLKFSAILLTVYDNHRPLRPEPQNVELNSIIAGDSTFMKLNGGSSILPLNIGQEGYFSVQFSGSSEPSEYSVQLITESGSSFTYAP